MPQPPTLTPITFNFYSLKYTPYKDLSDKFSSSSITKKVISHLTNELVNNKGYLIDRYANRDSIERRELFLTSGVFLPREQRIKCSIALIRGGRKPMIKPVDEFQLVPISKKMGSIAEQTHFYIDYSGNTAVLCVEYNYHGPRISDIEYYLRRVARDELRLARSTEITLFMDDSLDYTISKLKNVLNLDVKMRPQSIVQMDKDLVGNYFTGINQLGHKVKPQFIKLEALFQTPGKSFDTQEINVEAKNMVLDLLNRFKTAPYNKDCFTKFEVKYQDKDGYEDVFTLLRGKKEILIEVDLQKMTGRKWYEKIKPGFDQFMEELQA